MKTADILQTVGYHDKDGTLILPRTGKREIGRRMPKYEKWDIYWAIVAYDDEPGKKKLRPVIIGYDGAAYIMSFYVTSQSPKPGYDCYPIKNWAKAGLQKQSVVRLDKMLRLQPDDVQDFIGHLSDIDIMLIELELARIANRSQ